MKLKLLLLVFIFPTIITFGQNTIYKVSKGKIDFLSDAPEETIKASTEKLVGLLDLSKLTFAFSIPVSSFMGFNSELQREHFNENYVESNKFPKAIFKGNITSVPNLSSLQKQTLEVSGSFTIHGVEISKSFEVQIEFNQNEIVATSNFSIFLNEHKIEIPSVVKTKLSNEILVSVNATLIPK